jgi:hypothetical protein
VRALSSPQLEERACELKQVREWVRLICRRENRTAPPTLSLLAGGHGDAFVEIEPYDSTRLVAPLLAQGELHARLSWSDRIGELRLSLDESGKIKVALSADAKGVKGTGIEPSSLLAESEVGGGYVDTRCARRVGWQAASGCMLGAAMPCAENELPFGMLRRCVVRCTESRSCEHGRCMVWGGQRGCIAP